MSLGNQILGWTAAAVMVGGALYYGHKLNRIGKPTKGAPEPFSGPEHQASRREVEARMKAVGANPELIP